MDCCTSGSIHQLILTKACVKTFGFTCNSIAVGVHAHKQLQGLKIKPCSVIVLEIFKPHKLPGHILTVLKSASDCFLFISVFLQHAHYTYDDEWPFLLVNVTQATVEKQAKQDWTLCISEKLREMRIVFLSLTMGYISSQYGLTKAQTKHFVYSHPRACIHAHTHTYTHSTWPLPSGCGDRVEKCCVGQ